MPGKKVLVIEDDHDISELIRYSLEREGYEVSSLFEGGQAVEWVARIKPDLVILDLMLPQVDGLEICRQLKADDVLGAVTIVMLTAKSEEADVVVGLQMGADDYITKPFSPKVLLARVKAVLRRRDKALPLSAAVKNYGHLVIDIPKHKVFYKDRSIELTTIEFDILEFLARSPGRVFSRGEILDKVWKTGKSIIDRTVDVHIRGLRKKLGPGQDYVQTIRGIGYCFKDLECNEL